MPFSEELESHCQCIIWEGFTRSVPKWKAFANGRLRRFGKRVYNKSLHALQCLRWGKCTADLAKPEACLQKPLCLKTCKYLCHAGYLFCNSNLSPFLKTNKRWSAHYSSKLKVAKLQIYSQTSENPSLKSLCVRVLAARWLASSL